MTDILTKKLLKALANLESKWVRKNDYASESDYLSWLPVAELSGGRVLLGLTASGLWGRSTGSSVQNADDKSICVFLLPVLETLPEVVKGELIDGLACHGLSKSFIDTFPFEKIVVTGLKSESEYWSSLALEWVLSLPESVNLYAAVEALVKHGETQKIRHLAKKIMKQTKFFGEGARGAPIRPE